MTSKIDGIKHDSMATARRQSVSSYDWDISPGDFTLGPALGSGDFGIVYQGRWHGTPVAVKVLKGSGLVSRDKLAAEVQVQRRIHHPNIIQFLGACTAHEQVAIVSEVMDGGSLADALLARPQPPLRRALEIALDCARGLNYLHLANPHAIIHRDLKPSNILLASCSSRSLQDTPSTELDIHRPQSKPGQAPIDSPLSEASCSRQAPAITQVQCHSAPIIAVDTGAVSAAREPGWNDDVRGSVGLRHRYRMTGGTGSYLFMAPEVFRHQPYNAKADVYSLGMIMYEMMAGRRPFDDMDPCLAAMHAATDDMRPEWPAQPPQTYLDRERALWPEAKKLVEKCWAATPAARPPCSEIIVAIESLILEMDRCLTGPVSFKAASPQAASPRSHSQSRVLDSVRLMTSKTFAKLKGKP